MFLLGSLLGFFPLYTIGLLSREEEQTEEESESAEERERRRKEEKKPGCDWLLLIGTVGGLGVLAVGSAWRPAPLSPPVVTDQRLAPASLFDPAIWVEAPRSGLEHQRNRACHVGSCHARAGHACEQAGRCLTGSRTCSQPPTVMVMETWDAIRARRNVRTYDDRPITR